MGTEEDIKRLRDDVAELYTLDKEKQSRLVRLEERSDNRDRAIEEMKSAFRELEAKMEAGIAGLTDKINLLLVAPAQKVASRWDEAVKTAMTVAITAVVVYFLSRLGLKVGG